MVHSDKNIHDKAIYLVNPYRECFSYASLLSGAGQPINSTKKVVP